MILNTTPTQINIDEALSSRTFRYKFNGCCPKAETFKVGDIVEFEYPFGKQFMGTINSVSNLPTYSQTGYWSLSNNMGSYYLCTENNTFYIWEGFNKNQPQTSIWHSIPQEISGEHYVDYTQVGPEWEQGEAKYYSSYKVENIMSYRSFEYTPVVGSEFYLSYGTYMEDREDGSYEVSVGSWLYQTIVDYQSDPSDPQEEHDEGWCQIYEYDEENDKITKLWVNAIEDDLQADGSKCIYAYRNSLDNKLYFFGFDVRYDTNSYVNPGALINTDFQGVYADSSWGGIDTSATGSEILSLVDDIDEGWFTTDFATFTRVPQYDLLFLPVYLPGDDEYFYIRASAYINRSNHQTPLVDQIKFTDDTIYSYDGNFMVPSRYAEDEVTWDIQNATYDAGDICWSIPLSDGGDTGECYGIDDEYDANLFGGIYETNLIHDASEDGHSLEFTPLQIVSEVKSYEVLGNPNNYINYNMDTTNINYLTYHGNGRVSTKIATQNFDSSKVYDQLYDNNKGNIVSTYAVAQLMEKRMPIYIGNTYSNVSPNNTTAWRFYQTSPIASGDLSLYLVNASDQSDTEEIHLSFTNNYQNSSGYYSGSKVIGGVIKTKYVSDPDHIDAKLFSMASTSSNYVQQILQLINNSDKTYYVYVNGIAYGDLTNGTNPTQLTTNDRFKLVAGGFSVVGATEYKLASANVEVDIALDPTSDNAIANSAVCSGLTQLSNQKSAVVFRVWPSQE